MVNKSIDVNEALAGLSPEEREVALQILSQYAEGGDSSLMENLQFGDFDETPVDIDTFLDSDDYLGKGL